MPLLKKNLSLATLVKDSIVPRTSGMGRAANLWDLFYIQAITSLLATRSGENHVGLPPITWYSMKALMYADKTHLLEPLRIIATSIPMSFRSI